MRAAVCCTASLTTTPGCRWHFITISLLPQLVARLLEDTSERRSHNQCHTNKRKRRNHRVQDCVVVVVVVVTGLTAAVSRCTGCG